MTRLRITYVGRHEQDRSNDDEGAVAHALRQLGHEVFPIQEDQGHWTPRSKSRDLLLFNKWLDVDSLKACRQRFGKIAFWYWDLVDWPADPTLARRCQQRKDWMARIMPLVDVGFCSDGDWVDRHPGKLVWLPQGADERVVGRGQPRCHECGHVGQSWDVLFTGISKGGGKQREAFVAEMQARYGDKLKWVQSGVHGRGMADLIAQCKVVVAPDSPVTDRYWSNRAWNVMGFGGFLLHPACAGLDEMAAGGFVPYVRERLQDLINDYLSLESSRQLVSDRALEMVQQKHLYRHRCEVLLKEVLR